MSELTQALQVDITYLGGVETSDPPQVLAVAIRVVPSEEPVEDTTNTVTDPQPVEPVPSEPEAEPFAPVELPAQDPVPAEIPYDGITLYGFQSIRSFRCEMLIKYQSVIYYTLNCNYFKASNLKNL